MKLRFALKLLGGLQLILDLLKGTACNGLNERAQALVHLKAYEDLLGDDANDGAER